jgi:hypothetical protein
MYTLCVMGTSLLSLPFAVRYFLKNKVSPDLCNEDGLTALHQVSWDCWGYPAPCLDGEPHLHTLSCPKSSLKRETGRESMGGPFEKLLSALETRVSVTNMHTENLVCTSTPVLLGQALRTGAFVLNSLMPAKQVCLELDS